jgi:hypothetical protein
VAAIAVVDRGRDGIVTAIPALDLGGVDPALGPGAGRLETLLAC